MLRPGLYVLQTLIRLSFFRDAAVCNTDVSVAMRSYCTRTINFSRECSSDAFRRFEKCCGRVRLRQAA